jgi:ABC-type dipeptide/oligopeptide/nickel transport system ATPase component
VILEIANLVVGFDAPSGEVAAVRGVSFSIAAGERLALMGESGCGKSVLALAVLGLLPGTARTTGSVLFEGREILSNRAVLGLRGRAMAVCWSNAERFFDPVMTVGEQIAEAYSIHHPGQKRQAAELALSLLKRLGFDDPRKIYGRFPFQLSGGMNQRAMIAMSLMNSPRLLFVDEPTRGLDDRNRDLLIETLRDIRETAMIIITHDVEMASRTAARFLIMKSGKIVDCGAFPGGLIGSEHPYTRQLAACALGNPGPGERDGGGRIR